MIRFDKTVTLALSLALSGCFLNHIGPEVIAVQGTVVKVKENWTYEPQCGIGITSKEKDCQAIDLKAFDAIVLDSTGHKTYFVFFTENGSPHPPPREMQAGYFILHRGAAFKLAECGTAYTASYCPYDTVYLLYPGDVK